MGWMSVGALGLARAGRAGHRLTFDMPTLELTLPYPPTVNHYWMHVAQWSVKRQKHIVRKFLTKEAKQFRKDVISAIHKAFDEPPNLTGRLFVHIVEHYGPDGRPQDIDNCIKPLFDALEFAKMYVNDNQIGAMFVVQGRRAAVGRVEIAFRPFGDVYKADSF